MHHHMSASNQSLDWHLKLESLSQICSLRWLLQVIVLNGMTSVPCFPDIVASACFSCYDVSQTLSSTNCWSRMDQPGKRDSKELP